MDRTTCELDKRPLFSIADFTFYQGISCILGDNGVGKSTLFRSILQFQKYKGLITWKGTVLKKKKSLVSDGKTVILCDHDLSDYEAYIDHMVELRDGQLKENKIKSLPLS